MRIRGGFLFAAALGTCLAAGCSSMSWREPVPYPKPRAVEASPRRDALDLRLALVLTGVPPGEEEPSVSDRFRPPIGAEMAGELARGMEEALEEAGTFKDVVLLDAGGDGMRRARDANADLLLEVAVNDWLVSYEGTNKRFIWACIIGAYTWAGCWFFADEDYQARAEIRARLSSVHTGQEVQTWSRSPVDRVALSEPVKGWTIPGLLVNWPGWLGVRNWRKIGELLGPRLIDEAAADLARLASGELRDAVDTDDFRRDSAKTQALIVGVSRYLEWAAGELPAAEEDARRVREVLARGERFLPEHAANLTGAAASRSAVLDSLDGFRTRSRALDSFVLAWSGRGATVEGRGYLLCADSDPEDIPATSLSIEDLAGALAGFQAALPRAQVLVAASPGQAAMDKEDAGLGLLTAFLLEGAEGAADKAGDGNGTAPASELFPWVSRRVSTRAIVAGRPQVPWLRVDKDDPSPWSGPAGQR